MLALIGITLSIVFFALLRLRYDIFLSRKHFAPLRIAPPKSIAQIGITQFNSRNWAEEKQKNRLNEAKLNISKV